MNNALISKRAIRYAVREKNRIYSTANLKDGSYRISIPIIDLRYRKPTDSQIAEFDTKCAEITKRLTKIFPELKGNIEVGLHMRYSMYMSLRINSNVLAN